MNEIARSAEVALQTNPHPALRLSELLEILIAQIDRTLTPARLRMILQDYPDHFRILESWCGRWKLAPGGETGQSAESDGSTHAWVVAVADPETPPDAPRSVLRLRESVRWIGRTLDGRSRLDVSRWHAIALSERAARKAFLRRTG